MSDSDSKVDAQHPYGMVEGLVPKVVEGKDPGSVYTVVLRSAKGYVGVRRLGEDVFRVRCERFDRQVFLDKIPKALSGLIISAGILPAGSGERLSGIAIGRLGLSRAISVLGMALCLGDLDVEGLPIQVDDGVAAHANHVRNCSVCAPGYLLPLPSPEVDEAKKHPGHAEHAAHAEPPAPPTDTKPDPNAN